MKKIILSLLMCIYSICIFAQSTYTAKQAGTFHAPSTWLCSGPCTNTPAIPGIGDNAVINTYVVTIGKNVVVKDLTVGTGTLTFSPSIPYRLTVYGNYINNGTVNAGIGTFEFKNGTHTLSGTKVTTFYNIKLTNTTVSVESSQNIQKTLSLDNFSTFDADGSANTSIFKLISANDDPTFDGAIATLSGSAQVIGNVTVERFMSLEGGSNVTFNNFRIYRYISSPVQNAPVSQLQTTIPITGSFVGTSTCSGCGNTASFFYYNEAVITGDLNTGYVEYPFNSNTETLTSGLGYSIFVRGNVAPISTAGNAKWVVRNPINSGTITFPITYTSSGNNLNDGWNLVGNPYPSTIDWNASAWVKTGVNGTIYIPNNEGDGITYATYNGSIGTNGGSQYIAMGQAFWVKSDGGTINFQANENVKALDVSTTFFRNASISSTLKIILSQNAKTDEAIIQFRNDATDNFDAQIDAYKWKNSKVNISSQLNDSINLAINCLSNYQDVKLNVSEVTTGTYNFSFSGIESFDDSVIVFHDNFLDSTFNLSSINSYNFNVTNDPASIGSERFYLSFIDENKRIAAVESKNSNNISVYPNPVNNDLVVRIKDKNIGKVKVISMSGNEIIIDLASQKISEKHIDMSNYSPGIYMVRVEDETGKITYHRIIK